MTSVTKAPTVTNEMYRAVKTVTFDGNANTGAIGAVPLFAVTGDVLLCVFGHCTADLVSATPGSISAGGALNLTRLIAATVATDIDTGESWVGAAPVGTFDTLPTTKVVTAGADVIATVTTGAITGGTLKMYCLWRPLSDDGLVVPA